MAGIRSWIVGDAALLGAVVTMQAVSISPPLASLQVS